MSSEENDVRPEIWQEFLEVLVRKYVVVNYRIP